MYGVVQHSSYSNHHLPDRAFSTSHHGTSTLSPLVHHHPRDTGIQRPPESNARSIPHGSDGSDSPVDSPHSTGYIASPINLATGQDAGGAMRAELVEIQKADLGRNLPANHRYARVDRRPLDPPPVVLFRLHKLSESDDDDPEEEEIGSYDDVEMLGLVCTVDLFPVPGPGQDPSSSRISPGPSYGRPGREDSRSPAALSSRGFTHSVSPSVPPLSNLSLNSSSSSSNGEAIHHVNNFPITESSKCTNALVGATFIQPNLVEYQGKKVLVFVFADLAVKTEGNFILRYRVFNIYAQNRARIGDRVIMQAECYGGPFRVFSTKEFPGLQASTDLTKHLARWGVRLNIRETERRRRKKGDTETPPYTTAVLQKRKRSTAGGAAEHDDGASEDDD